MSRSQGGTGAGRSRRVDEVFAAHDPHAELRILEDAEELARAAAEEFAARAREAVGRSGRFAVALAGGSTPRRLYEVLAKEQLRGAERVPWSRIHVFWGDERCVPPLHADSNFRTANEALLSRVPIPQANIHRINAEVGTPAAAAELYEDELVGFFSLVAGEAPRFDLVLLGLGSDGHTASLFPGTEALREARHLVTSTTVPETGASRITLTLPTLNRARAVAFLVSGEAKAEVLVRIFERGEGGEALPAGLVHPEDAAVLWLVDRAAARLLHPRPGARRNGLVRR